MNIETILLLANYTSEEWQQIDAVIPLGCACVEFDSQDTRLKIGDGKHIFNELPYVSDKLTRGVILKALGFTPVDRESVGKPNGVAQLDLSGKLYSDNLPDEVKNIIELNSIKDAPPTGRNLTLYIDLTSGFGYRWNGAEYIKVNLGDKVVASKNNGYVNVNGVDLQVFKPVAFDNSVSADSENAVQSKAVFEFVDSKMPNVATYKKPGMITAGKGLDVAADGAVSCAVYTRAQYVKKSDETFISKGTLDAVIEKLQSQIDALKR